MIDSYKIKEGLKVLKREIDGKNIVDLYIGNTLQLSIDEKGIITTPNVEISDLADDKNLATIEYLKNYTKNNSFVNVGTYSEIKTLKDNDELLIGALYLMSDYKTIYMQSKTNIVSDSAEGISDGLDTNVEPLLLEAISSNEFKNEVYSSIYPKDKINYSFDNDTGASIHKGIITYREDTIKNVITYYDWRNIKFRRYYAVEGQDTEGDDDLKYKIIDGDIYSMDNLSSYNSIYNYDVSSDIISLYLFWDNYKGIIVDMNKYIDLYTFTDSRDISIPHNNISNIFIQKYKYSRYGNNVFMNSASFDNIIINSNVFRDNSLYYRLGEVEDYTKELSLTVSNYTKFKANIITGELVGNIDVFEDVLSLESIIINSNIHNSSIAKGNILIDNKLLSIINMVLPNANSILRGNTININQTDISQGSIEYCSGPMGVSINSAQVYDFNIVNVYITNTIDLYQKNYNISLYQGELHPIADTIRYKKYNEYGILESILYAE